VSLARNLGAKRVRRTKNAPKAAKRTSTTRVETTTAATTEPEPVDFLKKMLIKQVDLHINYIKINGYKISFSITIAVQYIYW